MGKSLEEEKLRSFNSLSGFYRLTGIELTESWKADLYIEVLPIPVYSYENLKPETPTKLVQKVCPKPESEAHREALATLEDDSKSFSERLQAFLPCFKRMGL